MQMPRAETIRSARRYVLTAREYVYRCTLERMKDIASLMLEVIF